MTLDRMCLPVVLVAALSILGCPISCPAATVHGIVQASEGGAVIGARVTLSTPDTTLVLEARRP